MLSNLILCTVATSNFQFFCCVVVVRDRYRAHRLASSTIVFGLQCEPNMEEFERGHTPYLVEIL